MAKGAGSWPPRCSHFWTFLAPPVTPPSTPPDWPVGDGIAATVVGAAFHFSLLWVIVLCIPFLSTVFSVSARIGYEARKGLVDLLRENYGRHLAAVCALAIVATASPRRSGASTPRSSSTRATPGATSAPTS